ncbi:MAG: ATP synthase F1 subunit gamma [Candidatus Pacebacteria bacterium]|jgi:F-type H+-transporting ATPase subunit gamma|nr:ATP synthase F1 subunit gamma [Candidatus Paceibacterota bacterium]MDD5012831.1 ATP synthase F1 subunit gamma [Candidatus Paceibacterota bacterium]MDD5752856.1 ATP synthase F1 subunit gamma [Candidatus Paceibacterota bacterium]
MDLREIKGKISSVKNISELTSALETFSALKMRKTQKRFLDSKPFAQQLANVLRRIEKALKEGNSVFLEKREIKKILVCVIASDRGFCGSFNSNLIKFTNKELEAIKKQGEIEIMPIGKKSIEFYKKNNEIVHSFSGIGDYWRFNQTKEISDFLVKSFLENKYQKIYLFYTHFFSSFIQKPTKVQLFPLEKETFDNFLKEESQKKETDYLLEPSSKIILDDVIPVFVEYLIYQFILSANTSEHSARMMAMRNASDNAKGLLEELRLDYNKARQEQITSEVCEISSTKEAME